MIVIYVTRHNEACWLHWSSSLKTNSGLQGKKTISNYSLETLDGKHSFSSRTI